MNKLVFICTTFYHLILIITVISLYEPLNVWKEISYGVCPLLNAQQTL